MFLKFITKFVMFIEGHFYGSTEEAEEAPFFHM
jgi:hypothetical protein